MNTRHQFRNDAEACAHRIAHSGIAGGRLGLCLEIVASVERGRQLIETRAQGRIGLVVRALRQDVPQPRERGGFYVLGCAGL